MTAQTEIPSSEPYAYDPDTFDHAAFHGFSPPPGTTRYDGWTPEKQRRFLEALSEGHNVTRACAIVGMSTQSAYAMRAAPRGQSFALGWQAAALKARDTLADDLMDRALNGVRDTITRDNGSVVTRHRHDNRHAMAMLNRLDRMAGAAEGTAAARLIAADFTQYLDLIERDAGPARAGVFLGARIAPAGEDDLAPIRALARADRWLRTHTDIAEPLDTSDLDPAGRASWTGEQWARAEAAGLVALAPPPDKNPENRQVHQPGLLDPDPSDLVWWDELGDEWRTEFPPPEGFDGDEDGRFGDDNYSRALSDAERAAYEARDRAGRAELAAIEGRDRDAFFGFTPPVQQAPAAPEPAVPADPAPGHIEAASCVEAPKARSRARTGAPPMSIFGSIKDAIFGHKAAAPAAPAQVPAGQAPESPAMPQLQQPAAAAPAAPQPVDVENVLMVFETERGTADLNWRTSIVDLMKLLGLDSSLDNRKALATELGYTGAKDGSAEMNLWLHKAVMQELAKNGGNVPASLKD